MKKAFVIGVILLFLGVGFQPVLANEDKTNIIDSTIKEDSNYLEIDAYVFCLIFGTYKTKTSNNEFQLILDSGKNNRTMVLAGTLRLWDWGKYPVFYRHTNRVWRIMAWRFMGISLNGFVFGIGFNVEFEPKEFDPPWDFGDRL